MSVFPTVGTSPWTPGIVESSSMRWACGASTSSDPLGQVLELGVECVDMGQQLSDHDAVVLDREAARERLGELRDLGAHLPFGEFGELLGVGDT
jgi:hypothetical protein